MQFQNPNILYALFALLIPIIVHLFQLRKFVKTPFTNVKFLQDLVLQTRKSSKIKKWLILSTRLLIFTCIILAFAQPYFNENKIANKEKETVIYIDNSFSMQEKGEKGELLKIAIQEVLQNFNNQDKISIITNNKTYKNTTLSAIKNELISLTYTHNQLSYKTVSLKVNQLFSKQKNSLKQFVYISDFQQNNTIDSSYFSSHYNTSLVQITPVVKANISIDSAYFNIENATTGKLSLVIKNQQSQLKSVGLSLYNNDSLLSKSSVKLDALKNTIVFNLPSHKNYNLKTIIQDKNFTHDNTFFITKKTPKKQQVLAIGNLENNLFLNKIFTADEFVFTQNKTTAINYSLFASQHLIILNELKTFSEALLQNIKQFTKNGGTVICIPSEEINNKTYNLLIPVFYAENIHETRLTKINFSHPIFKHVFEKKINNFQFPSVKKHYQLKNYQNEILTLENGNVFLAQHNQYYIFSGALNNKNTNIKQAPLIVPTLYSIAKNSLKTGIIYYTIGAHNKIDIPIKLMKNEVISLQKDNFNFIPLQQIKEDKVSIETENKPTQSGIYTIHTKLKTQNTLAFNYNKTESTPVYLDLNNLKKPHIKVFNSVTNAVIKLNLMTQVASVWKWFVIFALVFLLIELLILKYFK